MNTDNMNTDKLQTNILTTEGLQDSTVINQICRICAKIQGDKLIHIYSEEGLKIELAIKINRYLPINVSENDALPLECCWQCSAAVLTWHELYSATLLADETLKNYHFIEELDNTELIANCEIQESKSDVELIIKDHSEIEKDSTENALNSDPLKENRNNSTTDTLSEYYKIADIINLKCRECNKYYEHKKSLRTHIQIAHNVKFPLVRRKARDIDATFTCVDCGKSFTRKFDLEKHIRYFHPSVKLPHKKSGNSDIIQNCRVLTGASIAYKCDYCEKMFKKSFSLIRHRMIHTNERMSCCQICGKKFRTNTATNRHIRECHDNIKSFTCNVCGDKFKNKASLTQHENIHTDNRPFVCDVCGKNYRQKSSLYTHKLTHQNKAFECQICSQKFSRRYEAKKHSLVHTGERPHKCTECDRSFTRRIYLRHHAKIHFEST